MSPRCHREASRATGRQKLEYLQSAGREQYGASQTASVFKPKEKNPTALIASLTSTTSSLLP